MGGSVCLFVRVGCFFSFLPRSALGEGGEAKHTHVGGCLRCLSCVCLMPHNTGLNQKLPLYLLSMRAQTYFLSPAPSTLFWAQILGVPPDEFSYNMALKACSAGLWSGDSWSDKDGWGAKEERATSSPRTQEAGGEGKREGSREESQEGRASKPCRGKHAIEVR